MRGRGDYALDDDAFDDDPPDDVAPDVGEEDELGDMDMGEEGEAVNRRVGALKVGGK